MFFFSSFFFKVPPAAYESSQARSRIGAAAADLCQAVADPSPTEQGQGWNPHLQGDYVGFLSR